MSKSTATEKELTPEQIAAAKAARAKWAREYRAKHPEKNKEAIRRYWARRAEREVELMLEQDDGNAGQ